MNVDKDKDELRAPTPFFLWQESEDTENCSCVQ